MNENQKILELLLSKKPGVTAATAARALNKIKQAISEMEKDTREQNK